MSDHKPLISFDYAIKYLLRDKKDYSIVEGFLSALLKTQGYKPVKIISVLESESNKENKLTKKSLADMIVEDSDQQKYVIEIERHLKEGFVHKSCFNSSRLIVDHLSQNVDYTDIVKVIHISLLYFEIESKGTIYHGKTIIHDIDKDHPLTIPFKEKGSKAIKSMHAASIFPEYFYIFIPSFDDKIQKEIDEWLYVMKHDEVPEESHPSPCMALVEEKLNFLKMTQTERNHYIAYKKDIIDSKDQMDTALRKGKEQGLKEGMKKGLEKGMKEGMKKGLEKGIKKGIEKGKEEGLKEGMYKAKIQMIKELHRDGVPLSTIVKASGLTKDEIERILNDHPTLHQ